MSRTASLGLVLVLAFALPHAVAWDNNYSIDADSLGSVVLGHSIELMMSDGSYVEGKVIRATREDITLKVKRVEPKGHFQGREVTIGTSAISVVHMSKSGPAAVPIALGVLGGFAGGSAAAFASESMSSAAAAVTATLVGVVGGATGGALLGREAAKATVTINITQASSAQTHAGAGQ
jgi:hypothetical protein